MAHITTGISVLRDKLRLKPIVVGVFLIASILLLYLPVLHHQFLNIWDDDLYITRNIHVRSGFTLANVRRAFSTLEPYYWQPLTLLSHMADSQLFGLNSGAHHYVNVVLHATNALLLLLLLQRSTGSVWRSLLVAGLFALHPTNVESVAGAAERNTLLCTFFSLVTAATYGWYAQHPDWKRYIAVAFGFLLAMMSKPTAVTLPVILLLLDYWPLNRFEHHPFVRRLGQLILEKFPLLLVGVGISVLTMAGESASGTVMPLSVLPLSTRLENAVISYVAYVGKMLWPSGLSPFYPHPIMTIGPSLPVGEVAATTLILLAITVLVFYFRSQRYAVMGWLFFLITLVPMIGIVQTGSQARQDHFTYIPCIGLFILLVWGLGAAIENMPRAIQVAALPASLCILAGYAAVTAHYLRYWRNDVELFGRARSVAVRPDPWLELNYANALFEAGRIDEALQHYKASCGLAPGSEYCHYNAAEIQFDRRQFQDAVEEYRMTLMVTKSKDMALRCLNKSAEALLQIGEYDAAEMEVENALQIDPLNATTLGLQRRILDLR